MDPERQLEGPWLQREDGTCECARHACGPDGRVPVCVCERACVWHALTNLSLVHTAPGRASHPKTPLASL